MRRYKRARPSTQLGRALSLRLAPAVWFHSAAPPRTVPPGETALPERGSPQACTLAPSIPHTCLRSGGTVHNRTLAPGRPELDLELLRALVKVLLEPLFLLQSPVQDEMKSLHLDGDSVVIERQLTCRSRCLSFPLRLPPLCQWFQMHPRHLGSLVEDTV